MGLFFRKSKKIGPFRINLSSSGVGISTGIKGARVSVGPTGTFVHLGRKGIYYRKKIGSNEFKERSDTENNPIEENLDDTHTITTINFDSLSDSDSREFIRELEKKDRKILLMPSFGIIPGTLILLFFFNWSNQVVERVDVKNTYFEVAAEVVNLREDATTKSDIVSQASYNQTLQVIDTVGEWIKVYTANDTAYVFSNLGSIIIKTDEVNEVRRFGDMEWLKFLILAILLFGIGLWVWYLRRVDIKRKSLELYYAMEDELVKSYNLFIDHFSEFTKTKQVWQNLHSERAKDTKYTGGAGRLINRINVKKLEKDANPTNFLKTNVQIPHIKLKRTDLYFFPERLVLKREKKYASVFYKNLNIETEEVRFIEDGHVPSDAIIVDHTWRYVNKSGGPDKRFKDNKRLPICLYTEYHFKSSGGINEVISTSKVDAMSPFINFIQNLGNLQNKMAI